MFNIFRKKVTTNKRDDNFQLFAKRMETITKICNRNLDKAHAGQKFPVKEHVVISYEDLLKIWDIADRVRFETPVED